MPKPSEIEKQIPKLYRQNAINLSLFAYVRGVRAALHTVTVPQAILMFMDDYGIEPDELNTKSCLTTYNRMQKDLLNLKRSDNGKY